MVQFNFCEVAEAITFQFDIHHNIAVSFIMDSTTDLIMISLRKERLEKLGGAEGRGLEKEITKHCLLDKK